jgi:pyruvate dehydrogenase E1 component alpha subunit
MHVADFSVGMLGTNGVVAGGIPIAVGAAQGLRLLGSDAIVACFFGDGAINRGPFLEGLNWAALFRLPVLFVCEDNGVAAFTRAESVTAGAGVTARAEALGVPALSVDGNDAAAVDAAAARLVAEIRGGAGPRLLHATTYRLTGHTSTDPASWREAGEVETARAREPLLRLRARLLAEGVAAKALDAVEGDARAEMSQARAAALAAPWPDPAIAWEDVQDSGAAREVA